MEEPVARPAPTLDAMADMPAASGRSRYDDDFYTWAQEQVSLLRARRFEALDIEHLAEELEGLSKSEFSKLRSTLRTLMMHMLKWDQQPEHRTPSWIFSIREQRRRFDEVLRDNPGLKPRMAEARDAAYPDARDWAADETHLPPDEFPTACPYTWDELRERPFDFDSVKK